MYSIKNKLLSATNHKCRTKLLGFILLSCLIVPASFGATFTITSNGLGYQVVDGMILGVAPGDRIEIQAGTYGELRIQNIFGSVGNPIVITNEGGQVLADSPGRAAIGLNSCQYVHLTGTGSANFEYGFLVGTDYYEDGAHGISVNGNSTDIEIDHVEVFSAGFAGFNVKNEISENGTYNRGNYLMSNIEIHDNYVHDTRAEGFYVGHTFYDGMTINGVIYYPHFISGLKIYDNHTLRTGAEGIQVGSTIQGMEVFDNLVEYPGNDPFSIWQDNGIQIGHSNGIVLGNTVRDVPTIGIIVMSAGDVTVACNLIERVGDAGIFIDDRVHTPGSIASGGAPMGPGFVVIGNTIIDPAQTTDPTKKPGSINIFADDVTDTNYIINNLVVGGYSELRAFVLHSADVPAVELANIWAATTNELNMVDPDNGDYSLTEASSLIDQGVDIQSFGIFRDHANNDRAVGIASDIGAFEYPEDISNTPLLFDFGSSAYTTTGNWNNVTSTWNGQWITDAIDSNGQSTGISLSVGNNFQWTNTYGVDTDVLYPNNAARDTFYVQGAQIATVVIDGLDLSKSYTVRLFASRAIVGNRITRYTIGTESLLLDVSDNTTELVEFTQLMPEQDGSITLQVATDDGVGYGYLGVMELTEESGAVELWNAEDIGPVYAAGNSVATPTGFTVSGGGALSTAQLYDMFQYVYLPHSGDVVVTTLVESITAEHFQAAGMIMMRPSTVDDVRYAATGLRKNHALTHSHRQTNGAVGGEVLQGSIVPPYWIRLERIGDSFTSYHSADGNTWTQIGSSTTIDMPDDILIGLAVYSRTWHTLATAEFTNLIIE